MKRDVLNCIQMIQWAPLHYGKLVWSQETEMITSSTLIRTLSSGLSVYFSVCNEKARKNVSNRVPLDLKNSGGLGRECPCNHFRIRSAELKNRFFPVENQIKKQVSSMKIFRKVEYLHGYSSLIHFCRKGRKITFLASFLRSLMIQTSWKF